MARQRSSAEHWLLCLYVAGMTPTARRALANLRGICAEHLEGRHTIEVVDVLQEPSRAASAQIIAVPTLVRHLPEPLRKVVGDLSDVDGVLAGLDMMSRDRVGDR